MVRHSLVSVYFSKIKIVLGSIASRASAQADNSKSFINSKGFFADRPLMLFTWLFFSILAFAATPEVEEKLRALSEQARQNSNLYYDEVFDAQGNVRPHYQDILPHYLEKSQKELSDIRRSTIKEFRGDNALSPLPRIMPEEEYDQIKKGVAQRGKALLLFLQDYYAGGQDYQKIIPKNILERIVDRAGERDYLGAIDPKRIRFLYGPDIIRDADGVQRVLEDNTNFLGGQGDLKIARESLYRHMPEIEKALSQEPIAQPTSFYEDLLKRYRSEMKNPDEKIVVFAQPPYPDKEDYRLEKIWKELDVEWVTPSSKTRLVKKPDGLYAVNSQGKAAPQKVGFVIFNSEFHTADPTYAAAKNQWLYKEATDQISYKGKDAIPQETRKALERALLPDAKTGRPNYKSIESILRMHSPYEYSINQGINPGLLEAITKGQVLTNNTPGTEFINDKEFNMYVEDIIRHYTKEEPILKNLPAQRLYKSDAKGARKVDEEVLKKLEQNWDSYVVKVVDGRGGDGVWVGPKLSIEERSKLARQIREDTTREIIIQEYKHPSVMAGDIVDLRVLSQVGGPGKDVYVSDIGWSRAVKMQGDGKVNLSAGTAHEVTFIVRKSRTPASSSCTGLFSNELK